MDESAHPTKPTPATQTPEVEQLLRLIELQTAAQRERRLGVPSALQGASFRWGSLIGIIIFAIGSVVMMEWMVSQMPKPAGVATSAAPAEPAALSMPAPVATMAPVAPTSPKSGSPEGSAGTNSAGKPEAKD